MFYFSYATEISSLSSSTTVWHTINNSSMYVYKHFELIFVVCATLFNTRFTTDLSKSHIPMKSVHFIQILSIVLAIFAYYAGLCSILLLSYYAGIIGSSLICIRPRLHKL